MRIGIGLPQLGRFADIDTLRRVAIAAEASGLSSRSGRVPARSW
jgi:hypothetical protein